MFLGVDESNHGRIPEILTACFSEDFRDVVDGNYQKRRSKNISNRNLGEFEFRHIIFSKEDLFLLNKRQPMIIAICEFAKYFKTINNIERIFVDGNLTPYQLETTSKFLNEISPKTEIVYGPKFDQRIRLVNAADNWANALHRYYSNNLNSKKKKYLSSLITPKIEDYLKIL